MPFIMHPPNKDGNPAPTSIDFLRSVPGGTVFSPEDCRCTLHDGDYEHWKHFLAPSRSIYTPSRRKNSGSAKLSDSVPSSSTPTSPTRPVFALSDGATGSSGLKRSVQHRTPSPSKSVFRSPKHARPTTDSSPSQTASTRPSNMPS